jgi:two-component sensor histidine kinase
VAGTVFPLIIFSAAIVYLNYQAIQQNASARMLEVARAMSLVVDRELQSAIAGLEVLALSQALQRDDFATFRTEAAAFLKRYSDESNLALATRDGQQVFNGFIDPGQPLPVRRELTILDTVFKTGRPVVSNLFNSNTLKRPIFTVEVPVVRNGTVVYDIAFNPPLAVFSEIIRDQRLPADWVASVFDRAGVNVARTPNPERFVGQRAAAALYPRLLSESEGILENNTLEGIPVLTAFTRSPFSGWSVAIGMPRDALTAPLWRSMAITLAAGLLLLSVGLAFALRMANRIAQAEAHRDLLINELNHRVKNTLMSVQSVAARSLRGSPANQDAKKAFEARLIAMSGAHNVLSEEKWERAELRTIIGRVLEPYATTGASRLRITGPDVKLTPRAALSLAMVLHELATNAAKYGALSNATGRVSIDWHIVSEAAGRRLRLRWQETDGPVVRDSERKGFGTTLIERSIAHELNGSSTLVFEPSGVVCRLELPLAALNFRTATDDGAEPS